MKTVEDLYDELNILMEVIEEKHPSLKDIYMDELREELFKVDTGLFERIDSLVNRIDEKESEEYFDDLE